ncbi:MAG: hypothetical protein H3C64_02210 [Candidatus Kuenenia stuttgartiensis]|nr:hypothetical protein [Candidatus Kuenenia stuttgartiensis]
MRKHIISFWLFFVIAIGTSAQSDQSLYIGPGIGFDHGGFGAKLEFQPEKHVGVFGGLGYNLVGAGTNGGIIFNFLPGKRVTPVLTAMYGYNAVIQVTYLDGKDYGVYSGLTVGAGVDIKLGRSKKSKINVNLLIPFRNAAFFKDYNNLRQNGEIRQEMVPVAFSIGWNYNLLYRR